MDKEFVLDAFTKDADAWLVDGYSYEGYNYPVALQRMRIILKRINSLGSNLKIADLGCGGGDIVFHLAKDGHSVDGIDQSPRMIEIANERRKNEEQDIQERVNFVCHDLETNILERRTYDVVVSMGVIGYLQSEDILFGQAKTLLKPGGLFLVSSRNRLFNMTSISHRTIQEIENDTAKDLICELDELDVEIPLGIAEKMVERLKHIALSLPDKLKESDIEKELPSKMRDLTYNVVNKLQPRQHTPKQLDSIAERNAFDCMGHYGVHPHLINPKANKSLPPTLFNKISDILEPLEELAISLTWSSVFIGAYRLRDVNVAS